MPTIIINRTAAPRRAAPRFHTRSFFANRVKLPSGNYHFARPDPYAEAPSADAEGPTDYGLSVERPVLEDKVDDKVDDKTNEPWAYHIDLAQARAEAEARKVAEAARLLAAEQATLNSHRRTRGHREGSADSTGSYSSEPSRSGLPDGVERARKKARIISPLRIVPRSANAGSDSELSDLGDSDGFTNPPEVAGASPTGKKTARSAMTLEARRRAKNEQPLNKERAQVRLALDELLRTAPGNGWQADARRFPYDPKLRASQLPRARLRLVFEPQATFKEAELTHSTKTWNGNQLARMRETLANRWMHFEPM